MSAHDAERFQQLLEELRAGSITHEPTDAALRDDLRVVEALTRLATPAASPQAVERMSHKWRAAVQQAAPAPRPVVRPRFDAWRRAAAVLAFVVVAALGGGGGVVAASSSALPHDPLYGVKRAWESFVVWVVSLVGRLEDALIHLAEARYDELTRLLALGQATPQALDDFLLAYERAAALGDDPRLDGLRSAARLGLAQLPDPLRAAARHEVLRVWLDMPSPSPSDQTQASPAAAPASPTPPPAPASPTPDPILALSQTQAALQAQLEQTAQALALTQTALARLSSPTPSPTSRFAPTATRTPQPSATPTQGSAAPTQEAATPTPLPSATWTPLPLPTRAQASSSPIAPPTGTPAVWTPTPASDDVESPFIRLTIQAAHLTQTAQAAATEESSSP